MSFLSELVTRADLVILLRLATAAVLGGVVGYEREKAGKIAGLRTHTLVSLGSALFTILSVLLYEQYPSINGVAGYDYHLVANILVGIGFIGAGAIMRNGEKVAGTTTAASLWVVAAIGIASGFGYYEEAVATALLTYGVLTSLWAIEKRMHKSVHYREEHPKEAAVAAADPKSAAS